VQQLYDTVNDAIEALKRGTPVLIYDGSGRENEVDYVIHASFVTPDSIYEMRFMAGGLICYAMPLPAGRALGLRFVYEYLAHFSEIKPLTTRTLGYGDRPAFSLWVNHIKAKTGIRDSDRALTIRRLHEILEMVISGRREEAWRVFVSEFVAPGHVPILLGRRLSERRGHTELSLHLAMLAGMSPSMVIVEMLGRGEALSVKEAARIAAKRGFPIIEANQIIKEVEAVGEDLYCRYNLCES
jgi:3,4-dihydroxy 2-butanone 4-phosphate synthase